MSRYAPWQERFWSRVRKTATCWLWTGSTMHFGYGGLSVNGRNLRAHRLSWELQFGPIPAGMGVLHHCDVPACVRPDHLFLGTKTDNNRDRDAKRRQVTPRGERHGSARLTWQKVREIRASSDLIEHLARRYGVDPMTVKDVRRGKTWIDAAQADKAEK